jgi:hypothetical protein
LWFAEASILVSYIAAIIFIKLKFLILFAYEQQDTHSYIHTVIYVIGLSSIALALLFMILPNNNRAIAQQNNATGTTNNKTISITMTPNKQQQLNPYSRVPHRVHKIGQAQYHYLVPY